MSDIPQIRQKYEKYIRQFVSSKTCGDIHKDRWLGIMAKKAEGFVPISTNRNL